MPSTYTQNLGIEKPGIGEQSGTWGETANRDYDIIDRGINGVLSLTLSGTSSTLTTSDGTLSNGQYKVLVLGGSPSGTHTITISPNDAQKVYYVQNSTAQSVVFTQGSGGNVTIVAGDSAIIYANGSGAGSAVANILDQAAMSSPNITGGAVNGATLTNVTLSSVSSQSGARTALGLGTAAVLTAGTSANNAVQLDGSARLPAVDGSQLTNLPTSDAFPSGGIIIWSGSAASIPSGWVLCNGSNGTPDLRDRFVVGAGSTYSVDATGGQTAITSVPAHTHGAGSFSAASGGAHTHTITDPGHAHDHEIVSLSSGSGSSNKSNGIRATVSNGSNTPTWVTVSTALSDGGFRDVSTTTGISIDSGGTHTHTISGTSASTGDASVNILPPYYALCYIMKT